MHYVISIRIEEVQERVPEVKDTRNIVNNKPEVPRVVRDLVHVTTSAPTPERALDKAINFLNTERQSHSE